MTREEYISIHQWLRYKYGRAQHCESKTCTGVSRIFDWAVKNGKKHARNRKHYRRLCRSCHVKYDMTKKKKKRLYDISHTKGANNKRSLRSKGRPLLEQTIEKIRQAHRARHRVYCAFGKCLSLAEWAEQYGIGVHTLHARVKYRGYSLEEALTTKVYKIFCRKSVRAKLAALQGDKGEIKV